MTYRVIALGSPLLTAIWSPNWESAEVQLQQQEIQPEEMTVSANETASQFSMDYLFISSLRFSFILLQKH